MKLPTVITDQLFSNGRTHGYWLEKDVSSETIRELYDLWKWGPTSANCSPARVTFISSYTAKQRLLRHVDEGNHEKTMSAPVTAIIAYDTLFYQKLNRLFPHDASAPTWFAGEENTGNETAFRNSSLQGAYLMIAARSLGLDCGPMSGFDKAGINKEFFPCGTINSNFLCNIGYGNNDKLHSRLPRLTFDEACDIL